MICFLLIRWMTNSSVSVRNRLFWHTNMLRSFKVFNLPCSIFRCNFSGELRNCTFCSVVWTWKVSPGHCSDFNSCMILPNLKVVYSCTILLFMFFDGQFFDKAMWWSSNDQANWEMKIVSNIWLVNLNLCTRLSVTINSWSSNLYKLTYCSVWFKWWILEKLTCENLEGNLDDHAL
jgi:hypothetical protein